MPKRFFDCRRHLFNVIGILNVLPDNQNRRFRFFTRRARRFLALFQLLFNEREMRLYVRNRKLLSFPRHMLMPRLFGTVDQLPQFYKLRLRLNLNLDIVNEDTGNPLTFVG